MKAFAILGFVAYLWCMGCMGWLLGLFLDVRKGIVKLTAPVMNEIDEIMALTVWAIAPHVERSAAPTPLTGARKPNDLIEEGGAK